MRRPLRPLLAALVASASLAPAATLADDLSVSDRNDVRAGAHDIRTASMRHGDGDRLEGVITTYDRIDSIPLDPSRGLLGFAFDTDGDLSDLERLLVIYRVGDHLGGAILNGTGRRLIARISPTQKGPRTVEASFNRRLLRPSLEGYFWFAFASTDLGKCCFDTAPNRRWVLHDVAAPTVAGLDLGLQEGQAIPASDVDVTFSVGDTGGAGLERWELLHRPVGTSTWLVGDAGSESGATVASFAGTQGSSYELCLRAEDRSSNVSGDAVASVEIPLDDTSSAFSFDGSWTVTSDPNAFQGTRHVTSTVDATVDIFVPANVQIALVLPGGYDGTAWIDSDAGWSSGLSLEGILGPRSVVQLASPSPQATTLHLRVDSGTFAIDGLLGAPAAGPTPYGQDRRIAPGVHVRPGSAEHVEPELAAPALRPASSALRNTIAHPRFWAALEAARTTPRPTQRPSHDVYAASTCTTPSSG